MPDEKSFTGRFGSDLRHYRSDAALPSVYNWLTVGADPKMGGCRGRQAAQFTQ
jgi:hypothetical protein